MLTGSALRRGYSIPWRDDGAGESLRKLCRRTPLSSLPMLYCETSPAVSSRSLSVDSSVFRALVTLNVSSDGSVVFGMLLLKTFCDSFRTLTTSSIPDQNVRFFNEFHSESRYGVDKLRNPTLRVQVTVLPGSVCHRTVHRGYRILIYKRKTFLKLSYTQSREIRFNIAYRLAGAGVRRMVTWYFIHYSIGSPNKIVFHININYNIRITPWSERKT